jgi:hypothetical protein
MVLGWWIVIFFTICFVLFLNLYSILHMEYRHNRCSKCPSCSFTHDASLLIRDPCMRQQGILGNMFVRIFLFYPWNTYFKYGIFFPETTCLVLYFHKYTHRSWQIQKSILYANTYVIVHNVYRVLPYPLTYQLPCTTLCFFSHSFYPFRRLLTPSYWAALQLLSLHNISCA